MSHSAAASCAQESRPNSMPAPPGALIRIFSPVTGFQMGIEIAFRRLEASLAPRAKIKAAMRRVEVPLLLGVAEFAWAHPKQQRD